MSESAKRVLPYPIFLIICILVVAALSCCGGMAAALATETALSSYYENRARVWAQEFCLRLRCPGPLPVDIVIDVPANMPKGIVAHTTRRMDGDGCRLYFLRSSLERKEIVAHEACHCANDYLAIGPFGYRAGTPEKEMDRRERAAAECADDVIRGRR